MNKKQELPEDVRASLEAAGVHITPSRRVTPNTLKKAMEGKGNRAARRAETSNKKKPHGGTLPRGKGRLCTRSTY